MRRSLGAIGLTRATPSVPRPNTGIIYTSRTTRANMAITIYIIEDTARAGLVRRQRPQSRKFSLSPFLSLSPKTPQISPSRERAYARPRSSRGGARGQRAASWVGSRDVTRRGTRGARVSLVLSLWTCQGRRRGPFRRRRRSISSPKTRNFPSTPRNRRCTTPPPTPNRDLPAKGSLRLRGVGRVGAILCLTSAFSRGARAGVK